MGKTGPSNGCGHVEFQLSDHVENRGPKRSQRLLRQVTAMPASAAVHLDAAGMHRVQSRTA
jgi:hypothetical protein